jgi:hypothetical protein
MTWFSKSLFILSAIGLLLLSVSSLGAQQWSPSKDLQAVTSGQEGGKTGIIVVDGTLGSDSQLDQSQTPPDVALEPGDNFKPRSPGIAIEPGDNFQPKSRGSISHEDISPGRK